MDINDIKIDSVLRFKHMNGDTDEKPVLVLEVIWADSEVRILSADGHTGLAFPKELSEYSDREFATLRAGEQIHRLHTHRVNRLITNMFRLDA